MWCVNWSHHNDVDQFRNWFDTDSRQNHKYKLSDKNEQIIEATKVGTRKRRKENKSQ